MTSKPAKIKKGSRTVDGAEASVLILSTSLDFPTDRVCHLLSEKGLTFFRINRDRVTDISITIDPCSGKMVCRHEDRAWTFSSSLRSIYWRQATFDRNTPSVGLTLGEQLERSQWSAAMRGLMLFDDVRWVNHPAATYKAESKLYQLRCAVKLGFDVPPTIVTNDRHANAAAVLGNPIALKSVDTVYLQDGPIQYFGYTSIVDWDECADEFLKLAPATCQTVITPKLDLRVTVVGNRWWCDAVTHRGHPIEGDWRVTKKGDLDFREFELPDEVVARCFRLVQHLGLRYGAIDLALSRDKFFFIEINPTGEWGWLDRDGRGISQAIADELAGSEP